MGPDTPNCMKKSFSADISHTFGPSSCEMPKARAVLPVPGAPASNNALPAIFFDFMSSTVIPEAYCTLKM